MPSSRVFNVLVSSVVLLGSTAGVFAVGAIVPTAASQPEAASDGAGVSDPSSPSAADGTSAAAPSSAKAPASSVAASPKAKAQAKAVEKADGTGSGGSSTTGSSATGSSGRASSGSGSAAAGAGDASSAGGSGGAGSAGSSSGGSSSGTSSRPAGNGRVFIGATSGGHELAGARTGVGLAEHAYGFFSNKVPQAEMITVRAKNTKWRAVADAKPGSALHGQIAGWARTIKARGGSVMVAYSHEPEAHDRHTLGSAADYVAAWRRVKAIFDQEGASNVVWAWQMTAYSFKTKPSSDQHAAKWYPGDDVVDIVAADGYNWGSCGGHSGVTSSMASFTDPVIAFAKAHGKRVVLAEFGSIAGPGRAAWLKDAHKYLIANRDMIVAAFYFNLHRAGEPCNWTLTTAAEYTALRAMAQDTVNFRV
jgi:hypothetical protein